MSEDARLLINEAVKRILENSSSASKLKKLNATHSQKIHFIPKDYRVFNGILQSMNIQFGNFIEELMRLLIDAEDQYEIIDTYSGKKSNSFKLSAANDRRIDAYVSRCQVEPSGYCDENFSQLLREIVSDTDDDLNNLKHDIDLLFRDTHSGTYYYAEIKFNDDHDTGKFVDINRKFIKTYAYLVRELDIKDTEELVPILFFFNNKKLKGNIYVPEDLHIKRGQQFFADFLSISHEHVNAYMSQLSESPENVHMFHQLYDSVIHR